MRIILATALTLAVLTGCGGAAENKSEAVAPGSGNEAMAAPQGASNSSGDTATSPAAATNSAGSTAAVTVPGGLPVYPGATEVEERDGVVSFRAPDSWTEVAEFYVNASQQAGFQMTRGQVGSSERLTLTRGTERVHVTGSVVLGGRSDVEIAAGGQ